MSELPSASGWRLEPAPVTCTTARSALEFDWVTLAAAVWPSLNVTRIWLAPATTWAFVRMSPLLFTTMPEPVPSPSRPRRPVTVEMVATPGPACRYTAAAEGAGDGARVAADRQALPAGAR